MAKTLLLAKACVCSVCANQLWKAFIPLLDLLEHSLTAIIKFRASSHPQKPSKFATSFCNNLEDQEVKVTQVQSYIAGNASWRKAHSNNRIPALFNQPKLAKTFPIESVHHRMLFLVGQKSFFFFPFSRLQTNISSLPTQLLTAG